MRVKKKRYAKRQTVIALLFSVIFISLILAVPVLSGPLMLEVKDQNIISITPQSHNSYYSKNLYFGIAPLNEEDAEVYLRQSNSKIDPSLFEENIYYFEEVDFSKELIIYSGNISRKVSFCNQDGKCDKCLDGFCKLVENTNTCPSDCPSGSHDGYCDFLYDKKCDPDCEGFDFDCDKEQQIDEFYCKEIGGELCEWKDGFTRRCSGENVLYDGEKLINLGEYPPGTPCCVLGECIYEKKDGTDAIEKRDQQEDNKEHQEEIDTEEQEDVQPTGQEEKGKEVEERQRISKQTSSIIIATSSLILIFAISATIISRIIGSRKRAQLSTWIAEMRSRGAEDRQITDELERRGYDEETIRNAMR